MLASASVRKGGVEAVEPAGERRASVERDGTGDVLKADQLGRGIPSDAVDFVGGEEPLLTNELGHRSRSGASAAAPEPFDGVEARCCPGLDQNDKAQAPCGELADLAGRVGHAQPLCRH